MPNSPNPKRPTGPLSWLLTVFSSIWTGVILLTLLFIYCSLGSSGLVYPIRLNPFSFDNWQQLHIRQLRPFEMTEFEWFHWWPFDLIIALICVTLVVATIRRIPFRVVNYGVWMIHTGIIILALGSVIYFSTKHEGDTPVVRRQVVVELPTGETATLPVIPGNRTVVGEGSERYGLEILSTDPDWEILSGEDKGKTAYSVNVRIASLQQEFIRQLLAGYPEYTEDVIPGQGRAKKVTGSTLLDESIKLTLTPMPQDEFYLSNQIQKSWAIYVREKAAPGAPVMPWSERPARGIPLYNDYITSWDDVWLPGDASRLMPDPLDVTVESTDPGDPLADIPLQVNSYLRYALMQTRRVPGGDRLEPTVTVRIESSDGRSKEVELEAFDTAKRVAENGLLRFMWAASEEEVQGLSKIEDAILAITVPGTSVELAVPIRETVNVNPHLDYTAIEGTNYEYRVRFIQDNLQLGARDVISVAAVDIRTPDRSFVRWVSDDPSRTRDMASDDASSSHQTPLPLDENIVMAYRPGTNPPPITVVAGPAENQLRALVVLQGQEPRLVPAPVGTVIEIGAGVTMSTRQYAARSRVESRPAIVPRAQRNRDVGVGRSMVKVEVNDGGVTRSVWVPYHHYPVIDSNYTLRRFPLQPATLQLADGRVIEIILSRQRLPLPAPVVLDDFVLTTHVGGFTGQTTSIRDWTSEIQFEPEGEARSEVMAVSMNKPREYGGYWYFQAQWDPPSNARFEGDRGSSGLNYTVLGVGNRHGVGIQLLGSCIAVLGMIYAFYFKPIIKRRRQQKVYETMTTTETATDAARARPEAVPGVHAVEKQI